MHLATFKRRLPVALIVSGATVIGLLIHGYWRPQLPAVSVTGDMVLCRMKFSSFRFPLPSGARGVTIGPVLVANDTISGSILVKDADNAVTYDEVLRKHNFKWEIGSPMATSFDQPGGWVLPAAGGRIDFSYFGDL
jgi:hypothetical protein